jgi:hypothetical protein
MLIKRERSYIIKFLKTELNQELCQLTLEMDLLLVTEGGQVDCGQRRTLDILGKHERKACRMTVSESVAEKAGCRNGGPFHEIP